MFFVGMTPCIMRPSSVRVPVYRNSKKFNNEALAKEIYSHINQPEFPHCMYKFLLQ